MDINPEDLLFERTNLWNTAYDHIIFDNQQSTDRAKSFAKTKLDAFDEVFLPKPQLQLPEKVYFNTSDELYKCAYDVRYFIEEYCGIELTPIQYKMVNLFSTGSTGSDVEHFSRQDGSTTISALCMLHEALFNSYHNIGLMGHNISHARHTIDLIKEFYLNLPDFFQVENVRLNKQEIEFPNGCRIFICGSIDACRGYSFNSFYLDNVYNMKKINEFNDCMLPVIMARKSSRVLNFQTQ